MKLTLSLCVAFVLVVGSVGGTYAETETFDIVTKTVDTPQNTVWMIEVPNVRQATTSYPQITFIAGDTIRVVAGGCVKVGGSSPSYHQYVNPQGKDTDKYYHGLIDIPGITNGLIRIRDARLDDEHQLPVPLPSTLRPGDLHLTLGYEDTKYGDNGYLDHDWGPNNECFHARSAYLVVYIGHNGATTRLGTVTERISGLRQIWWAADKTGLKSYEDNGIACVVHNPKCGAVGHNGKDAWFNDEPPAGVTIEHADFKVFWPIGLNINHTDRGFGASTGSYGADLKQDTVAWQNTCSPSSDYFEGNLTYQISFLITRPVGVSMGPSVSSATPFADICKPSDIPTVHGVGPCIVNCTAPPPTN